MLKLIGFCLVLGLSLTSAEFDEFCVGVPNNTFVDDPRSCAQYFYCSNGVAFPGQCPDGLFFNPNNLWCDWAANVDCDDEPEPPPTPSTPEPTFPPTTPSPPIFECPLGSSQLFPHPQSCSLFILCFGGVPLELECPAGKHFSVELETCVEPDIANCYIDDAACEGVEDFGLIPSTVDCNEYFICFESTSIRRNCAPNLHFNPVELRCESQVTAGCLIRPDPEPECPDEFFAVIPHPNSCSHFFYCIQGVGQLQECAPGFLFDPENLHCDYASNVVCPL